MQSKFSHLRENENIRLNFMITILRIHVYMQNVISRKPWSRDSALWLCSPKIKRNSRLRYPPPLHTISEWQTIIDTRTRLTLHRLVLHRFEFACHSSLHDFLQNPVDCLSSNRSCVSRAGTDLTDGCAVAAQVQDDVDSATEFRIKYWKLNQITFKVFYNSRYLIG